MTSSLNSISQRTREHCRAFVKNVHASDARSRLPIRVAQLQWNVLNLSVLVAAYLLACLKLYQHRVEASYWSIAAAVGAILVVALLRSFFQSFVFYDDHILARRIVFTTKHLYTEIRSVNWVRVSLRGVNHVGDVEICFANGRRLLLDLSTPSSDALSVVFRQAEAAGMDTSSWLSVPDEPKQG
jgi:hypothetical protein